MTVEEEAIAQQRIVINGSRRSPKVTLLCKY